LESTSLLRARLSSRPNHRGQGLAEFALILPVFLLLFAAAVDLSRVYAVWVKLEAATRDAAEYAATNSSTQSIAETDARRIVCGQFGKGPTCTDPAVQAAPYFTKDPSTSAGASALNNAVTVTITTTTVFHTVVPYPLLTQSGVWTLRSSRTYTVLQGR
jgi:Flp pilus assembly protein TadG